MATTTARPAALGDPHVDLAEALTRDDRAELLRYMHLMRATEERALTLYRQGKVPGSHYDARVGHVGAQAVWNDVVQGSPAGPGGGHRES